MTSKVIQTFTGNDVYYKVIKDGYKTVTETIHVTDSMPTRNVYNLEPSTVVHDPELDYTVDTSHDYPPVITFNQNVITPDNTEITTNKYILATYGQEYKLTDSQQDNNFSIIGAIDIQTNGIVNTFSLNNYLKLENQFNPGNNSWEVYAKVVTGSSVTSEQDIFGVTADQNLFKVGLASTVTDRFQILVANGGSWINTSNHYGTYAVLPNTTYWIKAGFDGIDTYYLDYSLDGETYIRDVAYTSSTKIGVVSNIYTTISSGLSNVNVSWTGLVDLSEMYIKINNDIWWQPIWNKLAENFRVSGAITRTSAGIAEALNSKYIMPNFSPKTDTWEFTSRIYTSELTNHHNQLLHNATRGYAMCITRQGISGTPMSSYINNSWTNGTTSLFNNTWYWFRFSCTNKVCRLYILLDNGTYSTCPPTSAMTLQCTVTTNVSFINDLVVLSVGGDQYWGGKIDLKNTHFIESGRTWDYTSIHNLQTKQYTVGNISYNMDLVANNFSTANYIDLPKSFKSTNNWEFVTKFRLTNNNTGQRIWHAEYLAVLECSSGIITSYNWSTRSGTAIFSAQINKDYWVKCIINGTSRSYYVSEDGITYTHKLTQIDTSINFSANYTIRLGLSSNDSAQPLLGSIDLNGCYIKINENYVWKGVTQNGENISGILDSTYTDTGDPVTLKLYDVETDTRILILNDDRDVTVINKQYVEYNGEIEIPEHGLSIYDPDTYEWSKYRFITLDVDNADTTIYTEGNI